MIVELSENDIEFMENKKQHYLMDWGSKKESDTYKKYMLNEIESYIGFLGEEKLLGIIHAYTARLVRR